MIVLAICPVLFRSSVPLTTAGRHARHCCAPAARLAVLSRTAPAPAGNERCGATPTGGAYRERREVFPKPCGIAAAGRAVSPRMQHRLGKLDRAHPVPGDGDADARAGVGRGACQAGRA
jgi:hypothetical protein